MVLQKFWRHSICKLFRWFIENSLFPFGLFVDPLVNKNIKFKSHFPFPISWEFWIYSVVLEQPLIAKRLGNPALNRRAKHSTKLVTSKTVGGIVSCQTQKPQNQASLSLICTKRGLFLLSFLCPQGQANPFAPTKSGTWTPAFPFLSFRSQNSAWRCSLAP